MSKREIIIDAVGALLVATLAIVFGTNAVTTEWNFWALLARFGGAM